MKVKNSERLFFSLIAIFVLFTVTNLSAAQPNGKITGKIIDKNNNDPIIGVAVLIDGTSIGVQTNIEGRYEIANLSPGNYKLVVRYVSYSTKEISDVLVHPGKVTQLDVAMEENATLINEVVITSSYKRESIGALYSMQKNNISISDGISADIIRRSPDKNTSEVLKRVSGASIQDNKFVIVRGLSDRYNAAMINNAPLPSSEPDRKAFSFDIIPSNLIDRITISKTATPDLPGDFAGGVVQVYTKDIPDENYLNFSAGLGYNIQSTFKIFYSNGRGDYDYLGFSDGSRSLPDGFPATRQKYLSASQAQQFEQTKKFDNAYAEHRSIALPTQSYQLSLGNKQVLKNTGSFGSIASISYRNSQNINRVERYDYDEGTTPFYLYKDDQYKFNTAVGVLTNFAYVKDGTKLSFKNMFNSIFDESYTARDGYNLSHSNLVRLNTNELIQKRLFNTQLDGDHQITKNDIKVNWNLNYAMIQRNQPDLRTIFYAKPIPGPGADDSMSYTLVDRNSRRFYSELIEDNYGGSAALAIPYKLFKEKNLVKMGGGVQRKQRNFSARIFNYTPATINFDNTLLSLPKEEVFREENIGVNGFYLTETTNNSDKYFASSNLFSAFILSDNKFNKQIRVIWGIRVESYQQSIDAVDQSSTSVSSEVDYLDILPSLNFTYSLSEKMNIRLSGSKTVSRPEFRELAPFEFYDFTTSSSLKGNPDLKRSENLNADLRFEHYPTAGEAVTASFFVKQFNNPIEQIANSASNADLRRFEYDNAKRANLYGIELEIRKRLGFISESVDLNNFTVFANTAYIHSVVNLENQGGINRALQGQSPYLVNAGIQYHSNDHVYAFSALYNRVGQRIAIVGFQGYPDIYENARDMIDLQISKKVLKNQAELKLNVSDLLNQKTIFYQNLDDKKSFDESTDRIVNATRFGTSFSISFSYNLQFVK